MDFCFVKGCNAEQYKVSLDILDAVPEVLVVGMASLRLFVKRNFFRDGKNQAGKAPWTVKSRFRGQVV